MTYYDQNALKLCHAFWRERLRPGMTCVDATAGRGRDGVDGVFVDVAGARVGKAHGQA